MGKRSAVVELFLGDMGSIQRELRPSTQREDQLTMETKLEQIAVKAVNQLPKSVVREIRTPRSVGAGAGDRLRRPGGCGNGAMVEPLRHRQTKGAATDMFYLTPPRHISTLPSSPHTRSFGILDWS